jgi:hypothetical protein
MSFFSWSLLCVILLNVVLLSFVPLFAILLNVVLMSVALLIELLFDPIILGSFSSFVLLTVALQSYIMLGVYSAIHNTSFYS